MAQKKQEFQGTLAWSSALSCLLKMIPAVFGIILAQSLSEIVNRAVAGDQEAVLYFGSLLLFWTLAIKLLEIALGIVYERLKSQSAHKCKMDLYRAFLSNPLRVLYASEHGSSIEKLNDDFEKAVDKSLVLYPEFGIGIGTTIVYFGIIAFQNGYIACILAAMSLLQLLPPILLKKFFQVNYDNCRDIEAQITDFTLGGLKGFATIRLYDLKEWWLGRLGEYHKKYAKIGSASIYTGTAESVLQDFITMILKYGTCVVLGLIMLTGNEEMDTCVQAIALSGGFFSAVKAIFEFIPQIAVANVAQKRIREWFGSDSHAGEEWNGDSITLNNVSYAFGQKAILRNVSAQFNADKIYLIKGENGIGKSTLFRLMTGMLTCEKGEVMAGAVEAKQLGEDAFPRGIFYLMQDDVSFSITPAEMYEMIAKDRMHLILEHAEKFGLGRKQIYETQIAELSGGERKKVYLSLAFAIDPVFLLLDEPANSLDEHGREALLDFLGQRDGGAVIITNDSTLDGVADISYIVREGELINEAV